MLLWGFRAIKDEYALEAVGYVQLKRADSVVTVCAVVTTEHRVRQTPYTVEIIVNESENGTIDACRCLDPLCFRR